MAGNSATTRAFVFAISIAAIACGKMVSEELDAGSADAASTSLKCGYSAMEDVNDGCECDVNEPGSSTVACSVASTSPSGGSAICCATLSGSSIQTCSCAPLGCVEEVSPGGGGTSCSCGADIRTGAGVVDACPVTKGICCFNAATSHCDCGSEMTTCSNGFVGVSSCSMALVAPTCATVFHDQPTQVNDCRGAP